MDQFMKRAVELAADTVREGGQPFGAVLVKDGEIVAEGVNELHKIYDVSAHAELVALRKAQEQLQTHDLSGYTMYASGEPCPMCLTAMFFAGLTDVYYCSPIEEAADVGLGASVTLYEDFKKPREERTVKMKHMPLEAGQENPMLLFENRK
ncbi:nucleoside deaminase [Lentibacillus saliphilus]|uniref:nucleoside deaminase n=1 Tax=Lentibacillus saliphilus TaxID=2737028 RepID=UPI001C30A0D7|nr:nucleoside deaminase [Lentibacillus saliphilus]